MNSSNHILAEKYQMVTESGHSVREIIRDWPYADQFYRWLKKEIVTNTPGMASEHITVDKWFASVKNHYYWEQPIDWLLAAAVSRTALRSRERAEEDAIMHLRNMMYSEFIKDRNANKIVNKDNPGIPVKF